VLNNAAKYTPRGGQVHVGAASSEGIARVTIWSPTTTSIPPRC
jgi:hypothetical protein